MSLPISLKQLKTSLLDLVFPLRCLRCGREGSLICPICCQHLPGVDLSICRYCGIPLKQGNLCASCAGHPLSINGIRSQFLFEGTIRQAVHQLKYKHLKAAAGPLGEQLAKFLRSQPLPADILIPVPLHPKRLRQRGYNQSSLIAVELSRLSGLPVADEVLLRQRDTAPQARTASAAERRNNVHGAFTCCRDLDNKRVLLIDDVCTTGATLDACATALRAAGAGSVWGLTVAREMLWQ